MLRNIAVVSLAMALSLAHVKADGHAKSNSPQACGAANATVQQICNDSGGKRRRESHEGDMVSCDDVKMMAENVCLFADQLQMAVAMHETHCKTRLRRDAHLGAAEDSGSHLEAHVKKMCSTRMRRDRHAMGANHTQTNAAEACKGHRMRKDAHMKNETSCDCLTQDICKAYQTLSGLQAQIATIQAIEAHSSDTPDLPDPVPEGCADTCTMSPQSCDDVKKFTADGGCAASCAEDFKKQVTDLLCAAAPSGPPPNPEPADCVDTCTEAPTTCELVTAMIGENGCAAGCSAAFKEASKKYVNCKGPTTPASKTESKAPPTAEEKARAAEKALAAFDAACSGEAAGEAAGNGSRSRRDAHAAKLCAGSRMRKDAHANACDGKRMRKDAHGHTNCECLKQKFCAAQRVAAADPVSTGAATAGGATTVAATGGSDTTTAPEGSSAVTLVAGVFSFVGITFAQLL